MLSDKRVPVENSTAKMKHITVALQRFEGRRYYPPTDLAFDAFVEGVAEIVWDKPNGYMHDKTFEDGKPKYELNLGWVDNDLELLIKEAITTFTFCPSPKHLRALYCQLGLRPADGRHINIDLEDL